MYGKLEELPPLFVQNEGLKLIIRRGDEILKTVDMSDGQPKWFPDLKVEGKIYYLAVELSEVDFKVTVSIHELTMEQGQLKTVKGKFKNISILKSEDAPSPNPVPMLPKADTSAPKPLEPAAVSPDHKPFQIEDPLPEELSSIKTFAMHTPLSKAKELAVCAELGDNERLLWKKVSNYLYAQRSTSPYFKPIRESSLFNKVLDLHSLEQLITLIEDTNNSLK